MMKTCACILLGVGCMGCVNSKLEFNADVSLIKNRSNENRLTHSASNGITTTVDSAGGGKVDASLPVSVVPK